MVRAVRLPQSLAAMRALFPPELLEELAAGTVVRIQRDEGEPPYELMAAPIRWGQETLGMVVISGLIGAAYWGASWAAVALTGESGLRAAAVAASFAHTLVPIALAYAVAHYFTLVLFEGQLLLSTLSDPFGRGWDLFGTAGRDIQYWLSVEAVWYVQLVVILAGHVAGVVLAHDRALVEFSEKTAVRSQYAMLVLMVLLTSLGLTILAAG